MGAGGQGLQEKQRGGHVRRRGARRVGEGRGAEKSRQGRRRAGWGGEGGQGWQEKEQGERANGSGGVAEMFGEGWTFKRQHERDAIGTAKGGIAGAGELGCSGWHGVERRTGSWRAKLRKWSEGWGLAAKLRKWSEGWGLAGKADRLSWSGAKGVSKARKLGGKGEGGRRGV